MSWSGRHREPEHELCDKMQRHLRAVILGLERKPAWFQGRLLEETGLSLAEYAALMKPWDGNALPLDKLNALELFLRRYKAGGITARKDETVPVEAPLMERLDTPVPSAEVAPAPKAKVAPEQTVVVLPSREQAEKTREERLVPDASGPFVETPLETRQKNIRASIIALGLRPPWFEDKLCDVTGLTREELGTVMTFKPGHALHGQTLGHEKLDAIGQFLSRFRAGEFSEGATPRKPGRPAGRRSKASPACGPTSPASSSPPSPPETTPTMPTPDQPDTGRLDPANLKRRYDALPKAACFYRHFRDTAKVDGRTMKALKEGQPLGLAAQRIEELITTLEQTPYTPPSTSKVTRFRGSAAKVPAPTPPEARLTPRLEAVLQLDTSGTRQVKISSPLVISTAELQRLQQWLALQFLIEPANQS
jgi:hypothetical protein